MFLKRSHDRSPEKRQNTHTKIETELDDPTFDNRQRMMSPITEQSNEDSSSPIPVQMTSSQNDSIVTDTLLQLTSFSLKSLNDGDDEYDSVNRDLKQIDENFYIDASKNQISSRDIDEDDRK